MCFGVREKFVVNRSAPFLFFPHSKLMKGAGKYFGITFRRVMKHVWWSNFWVGAVERWLVRLDSSRRVVYILVRNIEFFRFWVCYKVMT